MFKSHILSFVEYRPLAIAHASPSTLKPLNDILTRLLVRLGISHEAALFYFNLAPLEIRRDIALLGLIHRAALRQGPMHLQQMFMCVRVCIGHSRHILDPIAGCPHLYLRRSIFGLIRIYNRLPQETVDILDVSSFQSEL